MRILNKGREAFTWSMNQTCVNCSSLLMVEWSDLFVIPNSWDKFGVICANCEFVIVVDSTRLPAGIVAAVRSVDQIVGELNVA